MKTWLFSGAGSLKALTLDVTGRNLPDDLGPWAATKSVTLQADLDDEQEAIALIREHGFCCFE